MTIDEFKALRAAPAPPKKGNKYGALKEPVAMLLERSIQEPTN